METGTHQRQAQHAILLGQFELSVDEANRILIPAEIRKALQAYKPTDYLYINIDPSNGKLCIYPPDVYEDFVQRLQPAMVPDQEELDFLLSYFPSSVRVDIDKQGRILIPELLRNETETGKTVMLVGIGKCLQIWNRDEWHADRANRRSKGSGKAAARWKQTMMPQTSPPPKI